MSANRIEAVRLVCRDVDRTLAFYRGAFGCRDVDDTAAVRALRLGSQRLEFTAAREASDATPPPPSNAIGFQHCAIVVDDMNEAMARLRALPGWHPISRGGPQTLPAASGGATAFKFRDPDGHPLEFLMFPKERVQEPWASVQGGPCLGIDHSAITVADADHSIAFYESLGFRLAARQWNRGPEQARLDGLGEEAVVEVVTLRPNGEAPPHLELLCYHRPGTSLASARDASPFATILRLSGNGTDGTPTRDPDGHRLLASSITRV